MPCFFRPAEPWVIVPAKKIPGTVALSQKSVWAGSFDWPNVASVPVSDEDALGYGMDATPTIVLVDRQGKVALYHPGAMTREELDFSLVET